MNEILRKICQVDGVKEGIIFSAENLGSRFIEEPEQLQKVEQEWQDIRDEAIAKFSEKYPFFRFFIARCTQAGKLRLTKKELLDARMRVNEGKFEEGIALAGKAVERLVYVICEKESTNFRKLLEDKKEVITKEFSKNFYDDLHLIYNWRKCIHPEYTAPREFRNPTALNAQEVIDRSWICYRMFQSKAYGDTIQV